MILPDFTFGDREFKCTFCGHQFVIQKAIVGDAGLVVHQSCYAPVYHFDIHVTCPKCNQLNGFRIHVDLKERCGEIMDWMSHLLSDGPKLRQSQSGNVIVRPSRRNPLAEPISAAELIGARRLISRSETHEDFMRAIGCAPADISHNGSTTGDPKRKRQPRRRRNKG